MIDLAQVDLIRRPGERVPAMRAANASDQAGAVEGGQQLFQVFVRNLLADRDLFGADQALPVLIVQRQFQHGSCRVARLCA